MNVTITGPPERPRQIKHNERWYIDPVPTAEGDFKLKQTRSDITVGLFSLKREADWVCNKLNHGKDLCEAARNILNVDDWVQREPKALVDDLILAVMNYTKDNN